MSINRVSITGNIGKEPELKATTSGTSVLDFSVAVSDRIKDQNGEYKDRANWIRCRLWGNRATSLQKYLHQGTKVMIEGKLRYDAWQTKDGQNRSAITVNVDEIEFYNRDSAPQPSNQAPYQQQPTTAPQTYQQPQNQPSQPVSAAPQQQPLTVADEDIPF